jgi:hypothetical protein
MLTLLNKHGWVEEVIEEKKGKVCYSAYIYKPAKERFTLGLHQFNNYKSLLQFISRFPFPLQDDEVFANTLKLHGWKIDNKKKWSVEGKDHGSYDLKSLRKEIWLHPSLLFQNISPSLSVDTIMNYIRVPKDEAEIKEAISSPPQSTHKPKKMPLEDIGNKDSITNSSSELKTLATEYCGISFEDLKEREKLSKQMVNLMKPANGWYECNCSWTDKWWQHEKATIAPWCQIKEINMRNESNMIPGIDFFWNFDDIANYIKQYGLERHTNSLKLNCDYSSDEWNVNRRIEELAKKNDVSRKNNFWTLLESTGWKKITPKGHLKGIAEYDKIFVPKWSNLTNENVASRTVIPVANVNFFSSEQAYVEYIKEAGHIEPSVYEGISEFFSNSPDSPFSDASSISTSPKTPKTPYRAVAAISDKEGSWQKRHKGSYVYSAIWDHLDSLGYRQVVEKGPFENTVWITPEARERLEQVIKKSIKQYDKVDIKNLQVSKDYFLDKNDLLEYVDNRYQIFRKS